MFSAIELSTATGLRSSTNETYLRYVRMPSTIQHTTLISTAKRLWTSTYETRPRITISSYNNKVDKVNKPLSPISGVIRARWWCYDKGILLRREKRLSVSYTRRRRCGCDFSSGRGPAAHELYRTMGYIDIFTDSYLLKVKYLSFFSVL